MTLFDDWSKQIEDLVKETESNIIFLAENHKSSTVSKNRVIYQPSTKSKIAPNRPPTQLVSTSNYAPNSTSTVHESSVSSIVSDAPENGDKDYLRELESRLSVLHESFGAFKQNICSRMAEESRNLRDDVNGELSSLSKSIEKVDVQLAQSHRDDTVS
eukprot:750210_1